MPVPTNILFTRDLRPAYYDDFHCLAEQCRVSCCKGWSITFGKKDYLILKRQQGSPELNEMMSRCLHRIRKGSDENSFYAEFDMEHNDCPLLRSDGLCALQAENGHEVLPLVCRNFPRGQAYLPSGYLEHSLVPSCEAVLALLWAHPEGIDFVSDPIEDSKQQTTIKIPKNNILTMYFQEIRSWCIDMLQDRRWSLPERILRMGAALKKLEDDNTDIPLWLHHAEKIANGTEISLPDDRERDRVLPMFLINNIRILMLGNNQSLDFVALKKEIISAFNMEVDLATSHANISLQPWYAARARFDERFAEQEYFMENLAVTAFFCMHLPDVESVSSIWKSFVNFCNLYSFYRFIAVMSCHEESAGDRNSLFRAIVHASRILLHSTGRLNRFRDEFFEHDSATLAHMAVLLSG